MKMVKTSLDEITQEIIDRQKRIGTSIFEIGCRLKYVKENDLTHGEFAKWLNSIDIKSRTAQRMMQAYEQFGNTSASTKLTVGQITELLTLPPEVDREEFVQKDHVVPSTGEIKQISSMTTREVREVVGMFKGNPSSTRIDAERNVYHKEKMSESGQCELKEKISELENEIDRLKKENIKKDKIIQSLERELLFQKTVNSFNSSKDNGLKVFATMVGLSESASATEIKSAFRKNRKNVHHDQGDLNWVSTRYNLGRALFDKLYQSA